MNVNSLPMHLWTHLKTPIYRAPNKKRPLKEVEQQTTNSSEIHSTEWEEDQRSLLKLKAIERLSVDFDQVSPPETPLSKMLGQLSGINPYADRLLTTLGYETSFSRPTENAEADAHLQEKVSLMLKQVGSHIIEDYLQENQDAGQDKLSEALQHMTNLLHRGAITGMEGRLNPLSGYFRRVKLTEDGSVNEFETQDLERWAKGVLWNAPGWGELPEVHISEADQEELLQGYMTAVLSSLPSHDFDMSNITQLFALLSGQHDRSYADIKERFVDSLSFIRSQLAEPSRVEEFDAELDHMGFTWNQDAKQFEVRF